MKKLLLVLFFFQISSNAFGIISKEKKPCYLNSSDLNRNLINSEAEKIAFINGINEAIGWTECCIPELELREG